MSGLVGYVGYECGALIEESVALPASPYAMPDLYFGVYDGCVAFDIARRKAFIFSQDAAVGDALEEKLAGDRQSCRPDVGAFGPHISLTSKNEFRRAVETAIERIRDGEFYQANLSQRLIADSARPFDAYALFADATKASSAAYGAFLQLGESQLLSLSPERFFVVDSPRDGRRQSIVAEPIKGTRPRGRSKEEDETLLAALISDAKDRAENIMIADLTRNDLSRICADFSILEDAICEPVSHANVHHLVSRISGGLCGDVDAVDALKALFPCGSITGAPKVQSMKAIAEIEGVGRGPYCGAIGYIDDRGGADFSVAIRIAIAEGRRLTVPVGGGVTLRSDPQSEYEETIAKARGWLDVIGDRSCAE